MIAADPFMQESESLSVFIGKGMVGGFVGGAFTSYVSASRGGGELGIAEQGFCPVFVLGQE